MLRMVFSMARMSKRISNKITKTKEQQNAPKEQKSTVKIFG